MGKTKKKKIPVGLSNRKSKPHDDASLVPSSSLELVTGVGTPLPEQTEQTNDANESAGQVLYEMSERDLDSKSCSNESHTLGEDDTISLVDDSKLDDVTQPPKHFVKKNAP